MESLRECTFKPAIENMRRSNLTVEGGQGRKCDELYNLSKTMKRSDRTKEEMEY